MRARVVAIALMLAGCRQIFGLHEIAARDAGRDTRAATDDSRAKDGPPLDAAADAPHGDLGIGCGTNVWCAVGQTCCLTGNPVCGTGTCPEPFSCDDTADCSNNPGFICCATHGTTNNSIKNSMCAGSCAANNSQIRLCDPNVGDCGIGKQCMSLAGYTGAPPGYWGCM